MRLVFTKEDLEGRYLPADGTFIVKIAKVEYKTSAKGEQMAVFEMRGTGEHEGQIMPERIVTAEKYRFRFKDLYLAAGFEIPQLREGVEIEDLLGKFVGLKRTFLGQKTGVDGKVWPDSKNVYYRLTDEEISKAQGEAEDDLPF